MNELIEFIVKKLVRHPEDVQVRVIETDQEQNLELIVNNDDMGRVIGKDGRTAKAIRSLLTTATTKSGIRTNLRIVE